MKKSILFLLIIIASVSLCINCSSNFCSNLDKSTMAPEMIFVKGATVKGGALTHNEASAGNGTFTGVFPVGRNVTLSDFYIGKYEITQKEYERVMRNQEVMIEGAPLKLASNPSKCKKESTEYISFPDERQELRPVDSVTYYDALWYCNVLSSKEGLEPVYKIKVHTISGTNHVNHIIRADVEFNPRANGYRLPTEAEWEYVARGGSTTAVDWNYFFSGVETVSSGSPCSLNANSALDTIGWYGYNNVTGVTTTTTQVNILANIGKGSHQVGLRKPNRLGVYDMCGNVSEWCFDVYYANVGTGDVTNPISGVSGKDENFHSMKGGNWNNPAPLDCVTRRVGGLSGSDNSLYGFRIARNAE